MTDASTPVTCDNRALIPPLNDLEKNHSIDLSAVVTRDGKDPAHCGSFADVWIGRYRENTNPLTTLKVAIKVLRLVGSNPSVNNEQSGQSNGQLSDPEVETVRRYLNREAQAWNGLDHPNVLKFLGLSQSLGRSGCPALISPYCDNDTIDQYLRFHPEKDRIFMIKGVAQGLEYLHQKKVVHGDLKPNNILVDNSGNPLLCDFGRSKILTFKGFTATRAAGACRYQAPELLTEETGPTEATDVYAFALTSFKIWTDEEPYSGLVDNLVIVNVITKKLKPTRPTNLVPGGDIIWHTLQECWRTNAGDRPTMRDVVQRLG